MNQHVAHHIFHTIPCYHVEEATQAIIPLLRPAYNRDPPGMGIIEATLQTARECHFIESREGVQFFKSVFPKTTPLSLKAALLMKANRGAQSGASFRNLLLGAVVAAVLARSFAEDVSDAAAPEPWSFEVDWASGGPATTLPAPTFSVRKLEAFHYPKDGRTYAYADIVHFTDPFYPVSYSSEVGVFSSPDGFTQWKVRRFAMQTRRDAMIARRSLFFSRSKILLFTCCCICV